MNDNHDVPPLIDSLQKKLDAIDGVRAELASGPEVCVEYKGRRIGTWVPDGDSLAGQFDCEAAVLCAETADEACRLTVGRLA